MFARQVQAQVETALRHVPAVVLVGPRQVGKTTLALATAEQRRSAYLDLEDPRDLRKLDDPAFYLEANRDRLVVIDEVQRKPELFAVLRGEVDRRRRAGSNSGQFLLLGSASGDLLRQSAQSLAGRASYQELRPLNVLQVGADQAMDLWLRGGFPNALLDAEFSFDWRRDFVRTYLERDIPALGSRIPHETLGRFWTMLANDQAQLFNAQRIGRSLDVSGQAAGRYLDLLADLMLVRRLPPWRSNLGKRLVKTPKTFIRDSGVLHALLGIRSLDDLLGHPVVGASWEGFAIENAIGSAPQATAYFYRTSAGAEVELVLDFGTALWAVAIKRSTAPRVSRGFHSACEDLKPCRKRLVYAGHDTYPLPGGITVLPLPALMEELCALA